MTELPRICLVMALREESGRLFEASGIPVRYCGVGKVNAAHALTRVLAGYGHEDAPLPLVVNFGTAGSRSLKSGILVGCHEFVQRDMDVRALGFDLGVTPFEETVPRLQFDPLFHGLPAGICGTGDSFVSSSIEMACDVIDMEAYALAKVCHLEGARFACAKYITDGADQNAAADWKDRLIDAADQFHELYVRLT